MSATDTSSTDTLLAISHDEMTHEIRRIDTKGGHLLSLFTALTGATLAAAKLGNLPLVSIIGLWVAAAPMLAALVCLLLVVRPGFKGAPFERWAALEPRHVLNELSERPEQEYRAERIRNLSRVIMSKYQRIRLAVHLVMTGGTILVTALLVAFV